ncbi:MAG: archease [Armatimonadetes bacterium]|nr:archease [Armatimonadota bacterium]
MTFEIFDHTADKGIRAWGDDLKGLFETCAHAMFSMMADLPRYQALAAFPVEVSAPDREALLVAWLSELIFLFETERCLLLDFKITEIGETHLKAEASGRPLEGIEWTGAEVKAVTYHGLKIQPLPDGWLAEVIVDV